MQAMKRAPILLALALAGCCMGGGTEVAPTPPVASTTPAVDIAPALAEGTIVLANWHQLGRYYLGVVVGNTGGQASVLYADGSSELLPPTATMPDRLVPGLHAEVYDGTAYVPVTIERRVGHALGMLFPDGRRQWASVALVRLAAADIPATAAPVSPLPTVQLGDIGSVVLARYSADGYWYEAVVAEQIEGDLRRVVYCDGSGEDLPMSSVRADGITVGARIEWREHGAPTWQAATVSRRVEHAVEVQLDGGLRRWVGLTDVRVAP